jgi:hypothetical protein
MIRPLAPLSLALVALAGGPALAQSARQAPRPVPVERDLERYQRLEDRIEREGTGSLGPYGYGPGYGYARSYPLPGSGVAAPHVPGFDGPPGGILRDSVGNSGPLPPGSPVNAGNE